jgi:hypothetical protein
MRCTGVILVATLLLAGCGGRSSGTAARASPAENLALAERFIDAFYSFDSAALRDALSSAEKSAPGILYYQGWAEGGNYRIVHRAPCEPEPPDQVRCAITVEDDLIKALRLELHVTDTFRIAVSDGKVRRVETSSNDPPLFKEAMAWVRRERAERIRIPCQGLFAGGPTPAACVRAMVQGFAEFVEVREGSR